MPLSSRTQFEQQGDPVYDKRQNSLSDITFLTGQGKNELQETYDTYLLLKITVDEKVNIQANELLF
jgi:hypothetical protein